MFLLHQALRSFCLDAKRTKKIKISPNRSACLIARAQHPSAVLISVYDRRGVLGVSFPTLVAWLMEVRECCLAERLQALYLPPSRFYSHYRLEERRDIRRWTTPRDRWFENVWFQISDLDFVIWDLFFEICYLGFRFSDFDFRVSDFLWDLGIRLWNLELGIWILLNSDGETIV